MSRTAPRRVREQIDIYRGKDRAWRWRLKAGNGRTIAQGAEGHSRRRDVRRTLDRTQTAIGRFLRLGADVFAD